MKTRIHRFRNICGTLSFLALAATLAVSVQSSFGSITLYSDDFQSYPLQNPAPNPLTNGPAGGQWLFVDPVPPLTAAEHQILDASSAGAAIYSRVWASVTNNARLTNAISVGALPAGPPPYTFRLSFVAACDTLTVARNIPFNYAISSTAGDLSFVSGATLDSSQTFAGLSGTGIAKAGTTGKSNNRRFEFVFRSSAMTTADKVTFDITRLASDNGSLLNFFLDDVRLAVDDANGPKVQSVEPVLTLQHVTVNFAEPVDPTSATNLANYSFSGGALSVQGAALLAPSVVQLFTSDQAPNATYTLQISGILGESAISMTSTQLNVTTPALTISPLRYDAGTTTTQPSGPLDPADPAAGYWTKNLPNVAGFSVAAVLDDNSTGLNAWNITDSTTANGTPNYSMLVGQAASLNLQLTNGWRIVVRSRLVDNFGGTVADQVILYFNPGVRYGLFWGRDGSGNLFVNPVGALTYTVTSDALSYHTNMMIYNPVTKAVACYFDGRLLVDSYTGQALAGSGLTFGSASSAGKGAMNYNLVQLDVVGATQPVVLLNPASTTNGVGQKVTFTANFSPFVNAFQWLSNGVIIAGATTTNYTTSFIDSSYNGSQYTCRALSALGNVETAPAILTVTTDVTPPFIATAKASLLLDRITIIYSEPVLENYATNIANYTWVNAEVTNLSARQLDPITVELRAGPFVGGSNYTVRVSNVRDVSNLIITPNSPASVIFQSLSSLGRYDAGNTNNAPSGPPDPESPAGGSWSLAMNSDPNVFTNAIANDLGTGFNAWQVQDNSIVTGDFAQYTQQISTNLEDNARQVGWVYTVRARMTENLGTSVAMFAIYYDYKMNRYSLNFNVNGNNDLVVGTDFNSYAVTSNGSGQDYHQHQVVYDPASATSAYYCDGALIVSGIPKSNVASSIAQLMWGAASSAGEGSMAYNFVDWSAVNGPVLSIVRNGGNVDVSYRGILQAATQLGNPTAWTSVATNSSSSTNVYSIPSNSHSQQFFRTQLLQ